MSPHKKTIDDVRREMGNDASATLDYVAIRSERSKAFLKKMSHYSRYVLNDHILVVIVFLIGAFALQYSRWLKADGWQLKLVAFIAILLLALVSSSGKIKTYLVPADKLFLMADLAGLKRYIVKSSSSSLIGQLILSVVVTIMALPFLRYEPLGSLAVVIIVISTTLLTFVNRLFQLSEKGRQYNGRLGKISGGLFLITFVLLGSGYFSATIAVIAAVIWATVSVVMLGRTIRTLKQAKHFIAIENAITIEQDRQQMIYVFLSQFTDVKELGNTSVKRRRYLDSLVEQLSRRMKSPEGYLWGRIVVRNQHYLALWFRLTLVGSLFLISVDHWLMGLLVMSGVTFLTLLQWLPLREVSVKKSLLAIYPASDAEQTADFTRLIRLSILSQAVFLGIVYKVVHSAPISWVTAVGGVLLAEGIRQAVEVARRSVRKKKKKLLK